MTEMKFGWEQNVRKVVPYVPGEQPKTKNVIKLNTNENPYPPSPKVAEVISSFDSDSLCLYPDPTVKDLVATLAKEYGVKESQVFTGVGSDDVISMCFMTFFQGGKKILFPDVTYSFYDVWADLYQIPYKQIPLDADFHIQAEDYYEENGGIIFPNPNAPTGIEEPLSLVEDVLQHNPGSVVIIDEAYVDFGGETALPLLDKYDNLLITQTFSKSRSMAGMRIGFAIGSEKMISYLNDVKYSFNSYTMSRVAIEAGVAAVEDREYFDQTRKQIVITREWAKEELKKLGFFFPDSQTNFLFITHESVAAKDIFEALKANHIYVRYFNKPRIDNYLRVTIGTRDQMEALLAFLKEDLEK
jgi:histidinol-phosphate aminotransferase